jgi:hypothetical protein
MGSARYDAHGATLVELALEGVEERHLLDCQATIDQAFDRVTGVWTDRRVDLAAHETTAMVGQDGRDARSMKSGHLAHDFRHHQGAIHEKIQLLDLKARR